MKNYEWSNKHTSVRKCARCGKELEFADMKCPHCGADARSEQRSYRPRLSSADIQTTPRERIGAPRQPEGNYFLKTISSISFLMTATAVLMSAVIGLIVGYLSIENGIIIGVITGVLSALVMIPLARAIAVEMRNTAQAARNNERIALGIEYQIQQLNELITAYNRDKEIDSENAEVFAKLLVKISKLEEAQKNTLEELTNTVGAVSDKLTKLSTAAEAKAAEQTEEESSEEITEPEAEETEEITENTEEETTEEITEPDNSDVNEEDTEEEEDTDLDARSAGVEEWDDGFFDKSDRENSPTDRLDAFLDEDDD